MVLNTHHHTLKEWKTCIYLYHLQCELTLTLIRLPNAVFHVEQYFMKPVSHLFQPASSSPLDALSPSSPLRLPIAR